MDRIHHLPLDRDADEPLFRQIAGGIRGLVQAGALVPGERLPATRELSETLGVHRSTVQMAYRELESAGEATTRVGSGTRIAESGTEAPALVPRGSGAREPEGGPPAGPWTPRFAPQVEEVYRASRAEVGATAPKGAIDLSQLVPDEASYPFEAFRGALDRALSREGRALLGYGDPRGHPRLREAIARRESERGAPTRPECVLVTTGSQQGIELCVRAFVEAGARVAVSSPTYPTIFGLLRGLGIGARAVRSMRDSGTFEAEDLGAALGEASTRLVYAMPTFQNPTGRTWDAAARREFLASTAAAGVPVLEDDFEHELRFAGESLPSLRALAQGPRVVSLGTVSKGLFPGARVGWIVADALIIERVAALKLNSDLSSGSLGQAALAELIEAGDYDRHLATTRAGLSEKHREAASALDRHATGFARWTRPEGGTSLWVQFPSEVDSRALERAAAQAGVLVSAGARFDPGGGASSGVRLALSRVEVGSIERGIERLVHCARELAGQSSGPAPVFV